MSFTYVLSTNIGKVRNLIGDTVSATAILTDEEITAFLSLRGNDLYQTAATCLYRMAASKALLAKKKKAGDYSEDLSAIAKELRAQAKTFEELALSIPAEAQAEVAVTDFNYREIEDRKALRDETW